MFEKTIRMVYGTLKKMWIFLKKFTKKIFITIWLLLIALMIINHVKDFLNADEIAIDRQRVIAEFTSIQLPENSEETRRREKVFKGPDYSIEYKSTLDDEKIEFYYDKELKKRGWEKEDWRMDDPPKSFSYIKDKSVIGISRKKGDNNWEIDLFYQLYK